MRALSRYILDMANNHQFMLTDEVARGGLFSKSSTFFENKGSKSILVILPGGGYSCQAPALYYLTNYFLDKKWDVINFEYFDQRKIAGLKEEIAQEFKRLMDLLFDAKDYEKVVLVGKSFGCRILARYLIQNSQLNCRVVFLTPDVNDERINDVIGDSKLLTIIGDGDSKFEPSTLKVANKIVLKSVDHGLDIPGNVLSSIDVIKKLVVTCSKFAEDGSNEADI